MNNVQRTILKVYNAQGQEVATVFNGNLPAGEHVIHLNVESLPVGIYFYQISTIDNRPSTMGKLVLAR